MFVDLLIGMEKGEKEEVKTGPLPPLLKLCRVLSVPGFYDIIILFYFCGRKASIDGWYMSIESMSSSLKQSMMA